eukprot:COSAG06_NODE_360_length_16832_cov_9.250209_22_plen_130_part_00
MPEEGTPPTTEYDSQSIRTFTSRSYASKRTSSWASHATSSRLCLRSFGKLSATIHGSCWDAWTVAARMRFWRQTDTLTTRLTQQRNPTPLLMGRALLRSRIKKQKRRVGAVRASCELSFLVIWICPDQG